MLGTIGPSRQMFCPRKLSRNLVTVLARESPSYKSVASPVFSRLSMEMAVEWAHLGGD
jgi:hypothetical protein